MKSRGKYRIYPKAIEGNICMKLFHNSHCCGGSVIYFVLNDNLQRYTCCWCNSGQLNDDYSYCISRFFYYPFTLIIITEYIFFDFQFMPTIIIFLFLLSLYNYIEFSYKLMSFFLIACILICIIWKYLTTARLICVVFFDIPLIGVPLDQYFADFAIA